MDQSELLAAVEAMMRIRLFEDRVRREFGKGDMPGFVHTYVGAEAVAVGVCAHLTDADYITSTHRGHGHCLAKGVALAPIIAELYGRETGLCKGRGGSMHVADFSSGMLGANAIVGGGFALAAGAALAAQTLGDGRVAVSFFGDGAANQGVFHESLNLAAIWRLPVVFVCENNGWAESTPTSYAISRAHIADRPALRHPRCAVDASRLSSPSDAPPATPSHEHERGDGPTLLEAKIAPPRRALRRRPRGVPQTRGAATGARRTTRSKRYASVSTDMRRRRRQPSQRGRAGRSWPSSTPRSPTVVRHRGPIPTRSSAMSTQADRAADLA